MSRLVLKFENSSLKEVPLGTRPVTIGRAPDNDIQIDNLSVSNYHARVYVEAGSLVVEDLNSLNGSFLNDTRVERAMLKDGDSILIGKHQILVDQTHDAATGDDDLRKAPAPRVHETMILDTQERRKLLGLAAAAGDRSQLAPERLRIPTITGKLTVIGHSKMATVRLRGWFKPDVAAQINKHEDGYYLGPGDGQPKINGLRVHGLTKLNDGDVIEVSRVRLNFAYRD
jgi:predicted component of type VI protein secretion system